MEEDNAKNTKRDLPPPYRQSHQAGDRDADSRPTITVKLSHRHHIPEVMKVCTVGGPMGDIEFKERVKGKDYKCRSCGEKFKGVGRRPVCPSCQSEDVAPE
jgi:rubrerythrin